MLKTKHYRNQTWLVALANMCEYFELFILLHCAELIADKFLIGLDASGLQMFRVAGGTLIPAIGVITWALFLKQQVSRKKVLIGSSILVLSSSFLIAFLPTYEEIGYWSLVLFLTSRIIQTCALSVEPITAKIYAVENNYRDAHKVPMRIQLMQCGTDLGQILAIVVSYIAFSEYMQQITWSWRLPFLLGAFLSCVTFLLRWKLDESEEYDENDKLPSHMQRQHGPAGRKRSINNAIMMVFAALYINFCVYFCMGIVSPEILKIAGVFTLQEKCWFNLTIVFITAPLNTVISYCVSKFKLPIRDTQTVMMVCSFTALFFLYQMFTNNDINVDNIGLCRLLIAIILSGGTWNISYGEILKNFPINFRFKYTGMAWGTAKLVSFLLTGLLAPYVIKEKFGVDGLCVMAIIIGFFSVAAFWLWQENKKVDTSLYKPLKGKIE